MKKYILMIFFLALMVAIYYDNQPLPNKDYIQNLEEEIWLKNYYKPLENKVAPQALLNESLTPSKIIYREISNVKVLQKLN